MLALLLAALDQTIVGTAMPRIIADLHGFEQYAWVTTAYLLTSTAVVPISGKLSDMYGRKLFLCGSTAVFVLASALCGLSQDMNQLIVFRGLQGVAGGVLTSTIFTVISQIFPPAERGRIQGLFSGIFGLASIVGPLVGGYLTDNLSWRWVFYVNLPIGILALTGAAASRSPISSPSRRPAHRLPGLRPRWSWAWCRCCWRCPGAATTIRGTRRSSSACSPSRWSCWSCSDSSKAARSSRSFRSACSKTASSASSIVAMMLMAMGMFGTILFIPLYIQGVIGTNATQSGTVLMPMMITMIASSVIVGQIIARTGRYKLVGAVRHGDHGARAVPAEPDGRRHGLPDRHPQHGHRRTGHGTDHAGVHAGRAERGQDVNQLGVVTSLTQFARSMGSTIGVALFGSMLTNQFTPAFTRR